MKVFSIPLLGLLAAAALILADLYPLLNVVEANMVVRLAQTSWGGGGRMWFAAGLMIAATIAWALDARRWPIFFAGACLGLLLDILFSGMVWRDEQFDKLKLMGLADFTPTVKCELGGVAYGVGLLLVLAFFLRSAYPVRPPLLRKEA